MLVVLVAFGVSSLQDGDADELHPTSFMTWGQYRKNSDWDESMGEWYALVTEGGTCLYCSRVYIAKYSGTQMGKLKKDIVDDKEFADTFCKFRLWIIMETPCI